MKTTTKTLFKTRADDKRYILLFAFERTRGADEAVMAENFRNGSISADPEKDFVLAAQQQLSLELHDAHGYDLAGAHQCLSVMEGIGFDYEAMGWLSTSETMPLPFTVTDKHQLECDIKALCLRELRQEPWSISIGSYDTDTVAFSTEFNGYKRSPEHVQFIKDWFAIHYPKMHVQFTDLASEADWADAKFGPG